MLICCLLIFSALMAKDAHVYSGLKFGNFALAGAVGCGLIFNPTFLSFLILCHHRDGGSYQVRIGQNGSILPAKSMPDKLRKERNRGKKYSERIQKKQVAK
jgi:hypothetical protein